MSLTLADGRLRVERIDLPPSRQPLRASLDKTGQLLPVSAPWVDNRKRGNVAPSGGKQWVQTGPGISRLSGEDGHGMAMTGLALGLIGTILSVLVIVFAVVITGRATSSLG